MRWDYRSCAPAHSQRHSWHTPLPTQSWPGRQHGTPPPPHVAKVHFWVLLLELFNHLELLELVGCRLAELLLLVVVLEGLAMPTRPKRQPTIIFSTMARVSPSRSESLVFSGWILVVSILGSLVRT